MSAVVVVAVIIALAAILLHLLHQYLTPTQSQRTQNKAEPMIYDSDAADVSMEDHATEDMKPSMDKPHQELVQNESKTVNGFGDLDRGRPILENVMEALADPNTHLVGVYGSHHDIKHALLQRVSRRVQRDNLFDIILTVTIIGKADEKKIQEEIAGQLGFAFTHKFKDRRANELINRIKNEQRILIVMRDLYKGLDLRKVGIPFGADHTGCKILLTSTTEEVLSNQMHTQQNFMV